jgi:hypothetical protein
MPNDPISHEHLSVKNQDENFHTRLILPRKDKCRQEVPVFFGMIFKVMGGIVST